MSPVSSTSNNRKKLLAGEIDKDDSLVPCSLVSSIRVITDNHAVLTTSATNTDVGPARGIHEVNNLVTMSL
jgi:hypothetical protein